jgi:alanine racemase
VRYETNDLPIVGRICMNHTMIDLGDTKARIGTEIVVYSNDPTAKNSIDRIAAEHHLFNYNLLTARSPDVRRVIVD